MRTISPPAELMTEVARELLATAEALGHRPEVVATTTGAEFGYGFVVPADVFDEWFLTRGRYRTLSPETVEALDEAFLEPLGPEVPFEEEFPVTVADEADEVPEVDEVPAVPEVPVVPEVPEAAPKRRSRGIAKTTEEGA